MMTNDTHNKLEHVADLIDGRQPDEAELAACPSDPEEQELLRLAGGIGRQLYAESDKVKQMERDDWALFAAAHHLPETDRAMAQPVGAAPDLHIRASESRRHFWIGAISGAAASVVLCAVAAWMWWSYQPQSSGLTAYMATNGSSQVVLQSASGSTITLSTASTADTLALAELGAKLQQTDEAATLIQQPSECLDYTEQQATASKVEMQTLTVPNGKDFALQLADGTRVYLNAESRLEYPSRFEGAERIVSLQGEAYFEVAKDAQHPFVVQTRDVTTRVLGTTFVVRSYEQSSPAIALIEGRVEVSNSQQPQVTMQLEAGQIAQLAPGGSFELLNEDIDQFTYWRSGYFYYDDKELVEIATEIGRWYNVNVVFESEELMHLRMHYFCNRQAGIDEAIRILNYQPDLNINLADKTVYIH